MMKILLDTNIIIHREMKDPTNDDIGKLFWWIDKLGYKKCIHNVILNEIAKNKNQKARNAFQIKMQSYHKLPTIAPMCSEVQKISKKYDKTENDINDSVLINETVLKRVDLLITEDKNIHKKALELKIEDRVFTIEEFLEKVVKENPNLKDYKVLAVKKEYFGNINLDDEFFTSLKEDYKGFVDWFNNKSDEIAYICKSEKKLTALLYLKNEDENEPYPDIIPKFTLKKRLKIGSFKVDLKGVRMGERFLKIIFDNALQYSVDEIYVTIFPKRIEQERLINLLNNFGFIYHGTKETENGTEDVYTRDFSKIISDLSPKQTYPYFSKNTQKFIVPIKPEYHTELLPDSILHNESPMDFTDNEPHRNAISKVYVSKSINRDLKIGDLIIFYRTGGYYKSVITTIGVVESINKSIKDEEEFCRLCKKRSVFTEDELRSQWRSSSQYNRPFIVKFLYTFSFPNRINMSRLIDLGIIKDVTSAPRGFEKISDEHFNIIMEETGSNDNLIVD